MPSEYTPNYTPLGMLRRSFGYALMKCPACRASYPISQYFNVANDYLGDLPADYTYGDGPFREVRMLVDGRVAGVAFP